MKHYEFFLKHANKKDLDENLGEIIEEAEEEFKKHMIGRESREELRRIADRKGITLGDLIEEMMEVYQKTQ